MAIYRLEAKAISRGQGRSCVAAAAYRHATTLRDERQQLTHSYERKEGVAHSEIIAPDDAPQWARERGTLWNRADAAEKRKDAITAREVLLTLPRELSDDQRVALVRDFCREQFIGRSIVADVAIHEPDGLPDPETGETGKQPHAHIMLTDRALDGASPTGFSAKKDRTLAAADGIEALRTSWAGHVNGALERAGISQRVDHRSLERQRIEAAAVATDTARPEPERRQAEIRAVTLDRSPEPKIGPVAAAMVRAGRAEHAHAWRDVCGARHERTLREAIAQEWREFTEQAREMARTVAERTRRLVEQAAAALAQREALVTAAGGALVDDALRILNQRQQQDAERILAERQRQQERESQRDAGERQNQHERERQGPRRTPGRDRGGMER